MYVHICIKRYLFKYVVISKQVQAINLHFSILSTSLTSWQMQNNIGAQSNMRAWTVLIKCCLVSIDSPSLSAYSCSDSELCSLSSTISSSIQSFPSSSASTVSSSPLDSLFYNHISTIHMTHHLLQCEPCWL